MQSDNKMFEDFAKMMNGLAGTFAGMGREAGETGREKMKSWLGGFDFVSRDEFEAVKAMAVAARDEVEALRAQVAAMSAAHAPAPTATPDPDTAERAG
jgi:BMFP domain-containing protein YqiC